MDTENKEVKELLNELKSINELDSINDFKQTNDIGLNILKKLQYMPRNEETLAIFFESLEYILSIGSKRLNSMKGEINKNDEARS